VNQIPLNTEKKDNNSQGKCAGKIQNSGQKQPKQGSDSDFFHFL